MTLYAVGDLQGCLDPLKILLDAVKFDQSKDTLWLAGDLVNRGPDSIGCLKFIKSLGGSARTVLGNHDLHLLALHAKGGIPKDKDIAKTLSHKKADELMSWLAEQPILVRDKERKLIMTHAGIPPVWSEKQARKYAKEVETVLADKKKREKFFLDMYSNEPKCWKDDLKGTDRIRYIVNAFTRMRFCDKESGLEFNHKSSPTSPPKGMKPWFQWEVSRKYTVLFGHWAALMSETGSDDYVGLDTGYVWGGHLTLMNMDSGIRLHCDTSGIVFTRE